jgi:ABC-2 type transport system permease protein
MTANIHPRPYFQSVRRELWENRFLFIAPLAVALLVLAAYLIGTLHLAQIMMMHTQNHDGSTAAPPAGLPYSIGEGSVLFTGIVSGIFYCLGALYNDRRDRSILFWKSLPVSDLTTVASKASIPLLILPAIIFVITLLMQLVMLGISGLYAMTHASLVPDFWVQWPFFRMSVILMYCLATLALWHAPIYGWLLMVSAWAKRVPFLWAVMPPLALCIFEKIAFDSSNLGSMLVNRLAGWYPAAFNSFSQNGIPDQFSDLAPKQFIEQPSLWTGLAVTLVFLAAAVRLRRLRGPL